MDKKSSATLLDIDEGFLRRKLILEANDDPYNIEERELTKLMPEQAPHSTIITPKPGVVVKCRTVGSGNDAGGEKVFLNFCTSEHIPAPEDITGQELIEILDSEDPSNFRIPMSIGPLHEEKDKSGEKCSAYDIVVNPSFLDKSKDDTLFNNFFVIATIEALEEKYGIILDKQNWTTLRNKHYFGTAALQSVKTEMPLVTELRSGKSNKAPDVASAALIEVKSSAQNCLEVLPQDDVVNKNKDKHARLLSTISSKKYSECEQTSKRTPECVVRRVLSGTKDQQNRELVAVTAYIKLPGLSTGAGVSVLVGEDRVVLDSSLHYLDLMLPCSLLPDAATAHFATQTQTMVVTVPVQCS
uniref:PIH1 domain-containing protein 1 n=1 Tax=Hirondellea gigas TaxID=1518452 RepID=A0A2P2I7V0_9CRUS